MQRGIGDLLPGSLSPVGRDQDGGATQRIESPVGDVVEDVVSHGKKTDVVISVEKKKKKKKKRIEEKKFFKCRKTKGFSAPPPASRGE